MTAASGKTKHPTYCYQCVAGPDLLQVTVENGVATEVEPNFSVADVHPGAGKVCVKAYGLVQKTYNPHRIKTPMKRTNPKKGRHEDPGFVPITWDEALDEIAAKLKHIRETGLLDESGYPRVAASFGGGGTPQHYMGTFPAFLAAWGPIDFGLGSGQGVKCYHSEHLYGEYWHKAFTVSPDTPLTKYLVSFGANVEAGGGVCGVWRHAEARIQGIKRVQVEPALSVTGACSAEWVPIKPKTDPAFMFAMINVILHEHDENELDVPFLKHHTAAPYLVGPNGYFMRNARTRKPLMWDLKTGKTVAHDAKNADPALDGEFKVSGVEEGPDGKVWTHKSCKARPSHAMLRAHVKPYTPEWAAEICDVPAATIRNVGNDFLAHACIGETIVIDGVELPHRPVAISLGKTVCNGWGGYECCWARTLLACLVGGLEVPGGTLGTTIRLNKAATDRLDSVAPGKDGFMSYPMNPTDKEHWQSRPNIRNAYRTLVPLSANSAWSQALGPTHLAWLFQDEPPENLPKPTQPDVWFIYRTNPAISSWDGPGIVNKISRFPYVVAFAYTDDETNHMADILLPECTDLESTQLTRIGGTSFVEQFWKHQG
ncbi:MAG: molybdopterin-dependent oxidoreductase, partial [Fimbriimonadaceae bacterium]|nr:molybdopterin-dependent oxidoreductase [Alphaproteobacteria bacterium]